MANAITASAGKPIRDVPVRHTGTDYNNGQGLAIGHGEKLLGQPPLGPSKVGETRIWLALDDAGGFIYLKNYTLRGVGQHIEVWVANDLNFPAGDCRNDGVRNVVTDDQVSYLIGEFDSNIYPIESVWFSIAPERDGKNAILPQIFQGKRGQDGLNIPPSTYMGEGDNTVVLVDNVRDDNYYDTNNANTFPYIAGFYFSVFDDYFDRNVMSIDSFDWLHRTGADPAHEPSGDPCTSAPARPFLYESVFAHEYQHLLHHYVDPAESTWINEGLSDFAEFITHYNDPSLHVDDRGFDSHTQCILGWLSVASDENPIPRACGPENGLIAWGDQGADRILADYGFAYYLMTFLQSRGLGQSFFSDLHNNGSLQGIGALNDALAAFGSSTFESVFPDLVTSLLVDGYIDNGAAVNGAAAGDLDNDATEATVFFSPYAYATPADAMGPATPPGAPPWGSDYIPLGSGASLSSVVFDGDDVFVFPGGPQWVVDSGGYFTNPDVPESINYAPNQDLSIARAVSADGQVLSFDHYYAIELGWDFGFVQVSTNGGDSWQSLSCTGTTTDHNPGAISTIVANMPGYTGPSDVGGVTDTIGTAGAPLHATCDALPAGTDYISFRLMTDPAVEFDGWHVKNIQLNDVNVGTPGSLDGWDNQQFFSPVDLGFYLTLIGINGTVDGFGDVSGPAGAVQILRPTLVNNEYTFTAGDLASLAGYAQVVAVVSGIPAEEESFLYSPYSLLVNGVEKADGG
ncbi:MAG TPA: hypothetical protein VMK30_06120 [Pleomorphomonadaceae bacterium]|nr:hypothetical protein [Pleomorphomonadaceae bacterium]